MALGFHGAHFWGFPSTSAFYWALLNGRKEKGNPKKNKMKSKLYSLIVTLHIHTICRWTWVISDNKGKEEKYSQVSANHTSHTYRCRKEDIEQTKYEEHSASPPSSNSGRCLPENSGELCSEQLKQDMRNLEDLQRD